MLTLTTAGSRSQAPMGPGGCLPVRTHQAIAEITNGPAVKPARMTAPRRISTGIRGIRISSRNAMTQAYPIKWRLSSRTATNLRLGRGPGRPTEVPTRRQAVQSGEMMRRLPLMGESLMPMTAPPSQSPFGD